MADADLQAAFDELSSRFEAGKVDEPIVFYFSIGEEKWTMTIEPDGVHVQEGKIENADVFLKTDKERFLKMLKGEYMPGAMDFMSGKVKSNDPFKLKVLREVFGL